MVILTDITCRYWTWNESTVGRSASLSEPILSKGQIHDVIKLHINFQKYEAGNGFLCDGLCKVHWYESDSTLQLTFKKWPLVHVIWKCSSFSSCMSVWVGVSLRPAIGSMPTQTWTSSCLPSVMPDIKELSKNVKMCSNSHYVFVCLSVLENIFTLLQIHIICYI